MREIKFRAWLKETKEMIPVYQIDFNNGIINSESAWRTESEYILEQFTGLHDSTTWEELTEQERKDWTGKGNFPSEWKGREIYEGDVVKWEDKRIDSYLAGQICFNESQWQVEGLSVANLNLFRGRGVVIGNIHEEAKNES